MTRLTLNSVGLVKVRDERENATCRVGAMPSRG